MEQWVLDYQKNINTTIEQFFQEHYSNKTGHNEEVLREATLYAMQYGENSRIHTILAMVAYEEFLWITAESVTNILFGIDLIHTGLALHADASGVRNIFANDGLPALRKYGVQLCIIVGDILLELGIEKLSLSGNLHIVREALSSTGDAGYLRGIARDILTDHAMISEKEYLIMYDEKLARNIISSLLIGSMLAWDASQLLKDQFRQFGTFLARIYQVGYDIYIQDQSQKVPWSPLNRERWVVDFLGYEKAKALYEELYIELMKMTEGFQSPKFKDLVIMFRDRAIHDL